MDLDWLLERILNDPAISIKYVGTKETTACNVVEQKEGGPKIWNFLQPRNNLPQLSERVDPERLEADFGQRQSSTIARVIDEAVVNGDGMPSVVARGYALGAFGHACDYKRHGARANALELA